MENKEIRERKETERIPKAWYFLLVSPVLAALMRTGNGPIGSESYEVLKSSTGEASAQTGLIISVVLALTIMILTGILARSLTKKSTHLVLGVLALSPALLWSAQTLSIAHVYTIALLIALLLANKWRLGYAALGATGFFGISEMLFALLAGTALMRKKEGEGRKSEKSEKWILFGSAALALGLRCLKFCSIPERTLHIFEFGSLGGFGFFEMLFAGAGVCIIMRENLRGGWYALLGLVLISTLGENTLLALPYVALLTAKTIETVEERQWQSPTLKQITILVLWCSLLFSGVSYLSQSTGAFPEKNDHELARVIEERANGTVLLFPEEERGFFRVKTSLEMQDTQQEELSENVTKVLAYVHEEGIGTVVINQEQGQETQALEFVLSDKTQYTRVFLSGKTRIWTKNEETFIKETDRKEP